jgi:Vesicle coat protein involved in Golgi to plasma membrane transport
VHDSAGEEQGASIASLRRADTNSTLPTDFSGASTTVDSEPGSPTIERHPLFKAQEPDAYVSAKYRYGRAQGETCASCSFSVPRLVADRIPIGAPGSVKADGKNKNGAPVFRSREFVCMASPEQLKRQAHAEHSSSQDSQSSSSESFATRHSTDDCHDHTLTYLTAKSPEDPSSYALLRASVIRTLSCELLPRGMSDGPLCFGDSNTGYTIAYVFRLTDPKARGRRRAYAFVALAGKDASRAFRACPLIWKAFASMANGIEQAAQRHQDEQQRKEQEETKSGKRNYTPVSSFLTQRMVDPDGQPRRMGQTSPRSLAQIVGDENIFAILHQYFVALLRCLGDRFGGLPLADKPSVYQTLADEAGLSERRMPHRIRAEMVERMDRLREDDATPTPAKPRHPKPTDGSTKAMSSAQPADEIDVQKNKNRLSKTISLSSQCAPLVLGEGVQRQVVV